MDLAGQRVTVMGLGRFGGGVGVARFLARQGADVCVTDLQPPDKLAESVANVRDLPGVTLRLGEHNVSDFTTCDLVVANPAVKPDNRFLRAAKAAGVPITTEIRLLVERLPNRARTIGVTGTAGKSTVAAMIAHVLQNRGDATAQKIAGPLRGPGAPAPDVFLGGNIGGSLLEHLDQITPDDWVVLELSSFQLHHLRPPRNRPEKPRVRADDNFRGGWSPHIAVITNIAPNHLDWHGTFDSYLADKQVILDHQDDAAEDAAIGGPGVHDLVSPRVTRWQDFGSADDTWWRIDPPPRLLVPGWHNQLNARLAAAAVNAAVGLDERQSYERLADFPGLPHRLQFVAEHNGVRFFNDSKSTTPDAARLALEAFETGAAHLILGGYDKGSDLSDLARFTADRCAGVYTIGATGDTIADTCEAGGLKSTCLHRCGNLDTAVRAAVQHARPGQVVLLSPACASWDQFDHFEQRGTRFAELVLRYTTETGV